MSEAEKQEGQKTVVAFITGLLIGGLLVWVFSSSPEAVAPVETPEGDTTSTATTETETTTSTEATDEEVAPVTIVGDAAVTVLDQAAGTVVVLSDVSYPTEAGWIVVRDYMDGVPGNILGAARYNLDEALTPSEVSLLRSTVKDSSYQVVFFSDDGDKEFSSKTDVQVGTYSESFKAN
jgi:hypothetical protein